MWGRKEKDEQGRPSVRQNEPCAPRESGLSRHNPCTPSVLQGNRQLCSSGGGSTVDGERQQWVTEVIMQWCITTESFSVTPPVSVRWAGQTEFGEKNTWVQEDNTFFGASACHQGPCLTASTFLFSGKKVALLSHRQIGIVNWLSSRLIRPVYSGPVYPNPGPWDLLTRPTVLFSSTRVCSVSIHAGNVLVLGTLGWVESECRNRGWRQAWAWGTGIKSQLCHLLVVRP